MLTEEYYQFYLSKHQTKICRWFHVAGNAMMIGYTVAVLLYFSWWWLLLAPLMVYPLAFVGHYFDGHKPAVFSSNPLKARLADWRMCFEFLTGKI